MSVQKIVCHVTLLSTLCLMLPSAQALEGSVDVSLAGSTQLDDWGAAGHLQVIGSEGIGVDVGYQYLDSITYDALSTSLTHPQRQYEAGLLWQTGDKGIRIQGLAGGVFSGDWIQSNSQDVITRFQPGYQIGAGLSVPIFTRFRAFAEAGYQGWFNAEIPSHFRWRYGLRLTFGGSGAQALEAQERAAEQAEAQKQQDLLDNPPVTIDANVPQYVPGHLSQSLPPIVAFADLCKCFPAGPYTLQLGEFSNMQQAIRGLEYRGLRQFFNSRSYQRSPLPVFLAQAEVGEPVGVYLGELSSIDHMQYWRHELRKSGLSARFRKIVGGNGSRVANPIVAMDEDGSLIKPKYTAEEIRRMNSLPEGSDSGTVAMISVEVDAGTQAAEQEAYEMELQVKREELNKIPDQPKFLSDAVLQIGPVALEKLQEVLASNSIKEILARDKSIRIPQDMSMVWDEGKQEAWLSFEVFENEQHVDEWQAWFDSEGLAAERVGKSYTPLGDTYHFQLGQPLQEYSVEIERHEHIGAMLQRMRSPEVLWFQAYQRINEQPVKSSLNWSMADNRYHLIVTNVFNAKEQEVIWSNLTSVGLLPSLAEQ